MLGAGFLGLLTCARSRAPPRAPSAPPNAAVLKAQRLATRGTISYCDVVFGPGGDLLKPYARKDAEKPLQIMKPEARRTPNQFKIIQNETKAASGHRLETSCCQDRENSYPEIISLIFVYHLVDCGCHCNVGATADTFGCWQVGATTR